MEKRTLTFIIRPHFVDPEGTWADGYTLNVVGGPFTARPPYGPYPTIEKAKAKAARISQWIQEQGNLLVKSSEWIPGRPE